MSKDKLDIPVLAEKQAWQVSNAQDGIATLMKEIVDLQPFRV